VPSRPSGFAEFGIEETEQSISQRFEQQVIKDPSRIALKSKTYQLTYAELNQHANQVARSIIARGSSDGTVVLLLDHDIAAVIGVLGALKAGRPFVPIDPSLPRDRFQHILQDSQADLIVMNGHSLANARHLMTDSLGSVDLDQLDSELSPENLDIPISPGSTSWILYTSGSTGQPKGVLQTHRNELHNVMNHTNSLGLASRERFTLLGSYSTGQGMQDTYCALLNGGTLYPFDLKAEGPAHLGEWLIQEKITIYHSAATVFRHFMYSLSGKERFPDLRIVRLGSEQVTWKDVDLYRRSFADQCIFINALSSSECRTLRQICINKEVSFAGSVPVGYEVPDKKVVLLDDAGKEVSPGQVGEIAVCSRYLSPGYWRRPDLTSKAFTRDRELSDEPVYRSGDLGRFWADGALEHLGRKDFQVKIRGYRVEPHEVELTLLDLPGVKEALVMPRSDPNGGQRLVAYLAIASQSKPSVSRLRKLLRLKLPEYMIPASFVVLAALPLSPTGKLDVQSLPEPEPGRPELDTPYIQPITPVEEQLVALWIDILGVDRVGIHDSFFDLGGNSLLAALMISRTTEKFRALIELGSFLSQPTVCSLAQKIAAIIETGEEYIRPVIARAKSNDRAPLSYAQERLWFLDQWESGLTAYNICRGFRLTGALNSGALDQSLRQLVARHETLRTHFATLDGCPIQIVTPNCNVTIKTVEVESPTLMGRQQELQRLVREEASTPFDLASAPLLRAKLIRCSEDDHVLLLSVHQIVADGWSMQILLQDLWTIYNALAAGIRPLLPDLQVQYADFARWQRSWLQSGGKIEKQLAYWKEQLHDPLPRLEIRSDVPRPDRQTFRGAKTPIEISQHVTRALKELCRGEGISLFMILVAAFQALLHRYTGQEDVVLGVPIANRNSPEVEEVVGLFVNTLVLRTDFSKSVTFRELLSTVRDVCIGAYTRQDVPFERIVEELQPLRDPARNPLFQVMFILQNVPARTVDVADLTVNPIIIDTQSSKFDLTLALVEQEQKLIGSFEYNTDLFNRETIERMANHFQSLLESIITTPDQWISTLPLLPEAERRQLVTVWNDTATDVTDCCIHELFEAQVQRTPEAIAFEFRGDELTYRELNCRANQVAHYLQTAVNAPEKLVGICMEPSVEMLVGLLGILKAGGAYVPLDPYYPYERLQFMVEDSRVPVVLSQASLVRGNELLGISSLTRRSNPKIICLDSEWNVIAQQSGESLHNLNSSTNLAYVIYTSGSTGQPKGVQVAHQSLVNCLNSIAQKVGFRDKDVFYGVTTISFDIAALELYLPLLIGARVVLASREEVLDGKELAQRIRSSGVTVMQATPSTWRLLLDAGWRGREEFKILCGGEILSRRLADQLLDGGTEVWNLYGPTETTIWSTIAKVEPGEGPVPIGRPIANTRIYILDSYLQAVPVGVRGELYVGGSGLARGYFNRPELTAEKFITDPFSNQPGARLYRTGDLSRYRPDGNIEFLGRMDNQVKIRGHRIELDEIEFALNQHPALKEVVISSLFSSPRQVEAKVGVAPSGNGKQEGGPLSLGSSLKEEEGSESHHSVIAYLTPNAEKPSATELRRFLSHKLPEYMIPSSFVILDALPLTLNGKIDRSKLPPADGARPEIDQSFVEPRSELEELVTQIWCELLKCDRIGVHDNFFELGGHSLLATRVVARLRSNFGVDLPLRKFFELPTIAALTEYMDRLRCSSAGTSIPPIVPVDRNQPLPLSFSQRRLWYLQRVDPNLSAYNIPAAFRIRGDLDSSTLEQALTDVIARHEILRSCIKEVDGRPLQETAPNLRMRLPVTELTQLSNEQAENEANRLFHADARQLYDLGTAPLVRARLIKLSVDVHILIFNFHHIIADGSSLTIFYRELGQFYDASCEAKKLSLPALPVQYVDFAAWQQEWLNSDGFRVQLAYWKRQLVELPPPVELPTDFARPTYVSHRGARLTRQLSEASTTAVKAFSRQRGVTVFMMLFAAFNFLLSRITGQEDITVGSTLAGRNRSQTEGLIGFFINALPLRTDLSGDPTFKVLLERVRETCLDAYTHQEMPFEKIVEELRPSRDPGHNPIFDILFNVDDRSERTLTLTGCQVSKLAQPNPDAKFDLVIHAPEVDGKIELAIVYNTALFREVRIALLLEQWANVLAQAVSSPELPISRLSLITENSKVLLPDPTATLDDKWEGAIHEILAQHARRSPDELALVDPNQSWSYRDLNKCADRLANALIAAGIKPKDRIAIYAERNSSLVVAIFGILKSGAAFLILDPAYPAARTIDCLRVVQPKGWLQLSSIGEWDELASYLDALDLLCRIKISHAKGELLQSLVSFSDSAPSIRVGADDPAYIAFTSGSTGEPKAVLCRHGPITHFLPWQKEAFGLTENDVFGMLSGLAYSHLHRDVFTCVDLGATIFIPSSSESRSPDQLASWLERNAITVLHLTPALGQLLTTGMRTRLPAVRRVFFGGDVLTMVDVARIREWAPNAIIGSFYGATETQRAVGYYEITDTDLLDERISNKAVPLGNGIKNVQILVLNKSGQLAGLGELGEVFVRSPHLAAGYIGDDGLTQRMFIISPFTNDPADRLYRTGELGRYMLHSNVEWAGRNDRRINIRGFRVEVEEIESVLNSHSAVKNAAVVLQTFQQKSYKTPESGGSDFDDRKYKIENPKADSRLVAFIATDEESQSLEDMLRLYLSARLPDYMVPAHFVIFSSLPLSPNGKIDYGALPPIRSSADSAATASSNDIEAKLQAIFAEVLGRSDIGIDDNFFRLGGHSLLAARAAARIGDAFSGLNLTLSDFLTAPTVQDLAGKIASSARQINTAFDKEDREEFDL
jgi:amino acid adenylation domain-containing protein